MLFHVIGALAQMERRLIRERVVAGLAVARARGRKGGRPAKIRAAQISHARLLIDAGEAVADVARSLGVDRSTLYRALNAAGADASVVSQQVSRPAEGRIPVGGLHAAQT